MGAGVTHQRAIESNERFRFGRMGNVHQICEIAT